MQSRHVLGVALAAVGLLALLTSCGLLGGSSLSVTPSSIRMTANSAGFTVSNTGKSPVSFTASSSSPYVTLSPASGSVSPNSPVVVTATVDASSLSPAANLSATVTVSGGNGSSDVTLQYGIGTCGAYAPQALAIARGTPLARAGTTAQATPASRVPALASRDVVPGQIVVGYSAPAGLATAALRTQALQRESVAVRQQYALRLLAGGSGAGPDLVSVADVPATLAQLRADPRVRYAQRNLRLHRLLTPNDPYYPAVPGNTPAPHGQWNLRNFGLPAAWDIETGSSHPTVVAIIDDGVLSSHEEFQGGKLLQGYDFIGQDTDTNPGAGYEHGTHVAGIAAATGDNAKGIAGVAFAPSVQILPVKVFGDSGKAPTTYELATAIRWAAGLPVTSTPANTHPADVINMSVGVPGDQPAVDAAAEDAWNAGAVLVAAAGNHGSGTPYPTDPGIMSPANAPCVIAVGSVDGPGPGLGGTPVSSFSDAGPQLEVAAPGGFYDPALAVASNAIISAYADSPTAYGMEAGTSMASPFVAGVAALLKAHDPSLTPAQIRTRLDQTTTRPSGADRSRYGYGVTCADAALGAATVCGQP